MERFITIVQLHTKTRYYVNVSMLVDYFKQKIALHELPHTSILDKKTTQHLIIIFIKP